MRNIKKAPYRVRRNFVLLGLLVISCSLFLQADSRREEKTEIAIDTDYIREGQPVLLSWKPERKTEVKSCIWYVGEKEVQHTRELSFYIPQKEDRENWIRVEVTLSDGRQYADSRYFSMLPILYLDSAVPYEEVDKEENTETDMLLVAGEEYSSLELYQGSAQIHLRGNSTSEFPKRPFKLRLEEKADLLGMGKSRHWVLLANAMDSTLLRNQLVYELSGEMGAECWMDSRQVTLIYNGKYEGVYQLCEQIRVEENRVEIFDWENLAGEAAENVVSHLSKQNTVKANEASVLREALEEELKGNLSWLETGSFPSGVLKEWNEVNGTELPVNLDMKAYLDYENLPEPTGGVLLEMDSRERNAALLTAYHQPIFFSKPEQGETYPGLCQKIKRELQVLEYAMHDTDFTYYSQSVYYKTVDEGFCDYANEFQRTGVIYQESDFSAEEFDGVHYSELIDMDSLIRNFLLSEFTMNWDSMKNSVYLYKDIDDPFYLAPVWDYDWAWGNGNFTLDTWFPEEWQTTNDYFANETYAQTVQWNRCLIRDPYFLVRTWEIYWEIREPLLEELVRNGGKIDQYAEYIRPAAEANDERWGGSMGNFEGQKFDAGIASLKLFIRQRLNWLDEQFETPETLRASLGAYAASEAIVLEKFAESEVSVYTELSESEGVSMQVNGTFFYTAELEEGSAVISIPEEALREGVNTVQVRILDEKGNYLYNPEGTTEGEYQNAYSAYLWF